MARKRSEKKQAWVKYWLKQERPVLLVIGTFPDQESMRDNRKSGHFSEIRWMEISDVLRRESKNGTKPVKKIIFRGQRLDALSIRKWPELLATSRSKRL